MAHGERAAVEERPNDVLDPLQLIGSYRVAPGEQDRVGAVQQAIHKAQAKYKGAETLEGAVMASDAFFPFPDCVEIASQVGIAALGADTLVSIGADSILLQNVAAATITASDFMLAA